MDNPIVVALITLAGVVITALVTWSIAQRRIAVEHVTAERTKWRNEVRKLALKVHDAILCGDTQALRRLKSQFSILLSPFDRCDKGILDCIKVVDGRCDRERKATEFDRRISLLLKHDWERAKLEAGFFLPRWTLKARRQSYEAKGQSCGEVIGLTFREKYRIRPVPSLGLAIATVAGILLIWCWCDRSRLAHVCKVDCAIVADRCYGPSRPERCTATTSCPSRDRGGDRRPGGLSR